MNCPKCNATEIPNEADFCPNCGFAFNGHFDNETYQFKVRGVLFSMVLVRHGDYGRLFVPDYEHAQHFAMPYDYYMLDVPVTNEQWHAVMFNPETPLLEPDEIGMPMTGITQEECQEFIDKLKEISYKNFDLPTREEWIYADEGGHLGHLWTEEDVDVSSIPHKVKAKNPNVIGLFDLHNNVCEWTKTKYILVDENNEFQHFFSSHGGCYSGSVLIKGSCSYSNLGFRIVLRAPKTLNPITSVDEDGIFA